MRWLVEASSADRTETRTLVVDAESWEEALKAARAQRGEETPMSGLSIELLEDGYRVVDPTTQVHFLVKRAPESVPSAAPTPVGAALPDLPTPKVLLSREQEPTEASPLTYREYAFAVPAGTSEEVAVRILRGQLGIVDEHLANAKKGKLVNLAVFDVEFTGKPPCPPLATLTWKDWKGEPVIRFPRRDGVRKSSMPPAAEGGVPVSTGSAPPSSKPASLPPPAKPEDAEPNDAKPNDAKPNDAKPEDAKPEDAKPEDAAAKPEDAKPNDAKPDDAAAKPAEPAAPDAPPERAAPLDGGMLRTPSGRFVRGRTTGDELITALFEAMHDLHFLRDALEGGQFCLTLAMEVLPARAGLVHFFDIEKREWLVACTRGKGAARLLASRIPDTDELLREAARARRALVPDPASATAERYEGIGENRSLLIAPIMQAGRALGAIEIISPLDGKPFNEDEANAVTYIAEQYAEYLGSRGIVLDRARIEAAANT